MTSTPDAPLPALGELARKATECSALLARYRASTDMSHAATDAEWDECRDALEEFHRFCTPDRVLQLVALATGGAIAGRQQEQLGEKTANGQKLEPVLKEESPARCASVTGGGRYQCCLTAGHDGRHRATAGFTTWSDEATDSARSLTPERPADA